MGFNSATAGISIRQGTDNKITVPIFLDMFAAPTMDYQLGNQFFTGARVLTFDLKTITPANFDRLKSISLSLQCPITSEQPSCQPTFLYIPSTQEMICITPTNRGYGTDFTPMPIEILASTAFISAQFNVIPTPGLVVQIVQQISDPSNAGPWGTLNINNFDMSSYNMQG